MTVAPRSHTQQRGSQQGEDDGRKAGDQHHHQRQHAGNRQYARFGRDLFGDGIAQVAVVLKTGGPGHHQPCRDRRQNRRDLRDESVADGQDAVGLGRIGERHVPLQHADGETAQQVDDDDHDAGDRIALDELHRPVEAAVQLALGFQKASLLPRLILVQQTGP